MSKSNLFLLMKNLVLTMNQSIALCLAVFACLLCTTTFAKAPASVAGIYEYIYEHNTKGAEENHYLKVEINPNGTLTGTYWGTSDDFDESREGYRPGFFETKLQSVTFEQGILKFSLVVKKDDFFASPITPFTKKKPTKRWDQTPRFLERTYEGQIESKSKSKNENENEKITLKSKNIDLRVFNKVKSGRIRK